MLQTVWQEGNRTHVLLDRSAQSCRLCRNVNQEMTVIILLSPLAEKCLSLLSYDRDNTLGLAFYLANVPCNLCVWQHFKLFAHINLLNPANKQIKRIQLLSTFCK